jgi:hypothetical protein
MPKKRKARKTDNAVLPVMRPHAAGIDVGSTEIYVAVPADRDAENVRSFPTFTQDLYALADNRRSATREQYFFFFLQYKGTSMLRRYRGMPESAHFKSGKKLQNCNRSRANTILLYLAVCAPLGAQHQLAVTVRGTTATQVLLYYVASNTSACTVLVSESPSYSPLVADVDPALFTGAGSDVAYNILPAGTARLLKIGARTSALALDGHRHSRALAASTMHYVKVTCPSTSGTTSFVTDVPRGSAPEPLPTDGTAWGDLAYPEFDYTNLSKPVIDPQSGIRIYSDDPKTWSMSEIVPLTANWFGGGTGWVGPANVSSYSSAVAATNNTNPLVLYVDTTKFTDQTRISGGYWPFDNFLDLGVDLYGSASDGKTAANRTVQMALSLDSGQTAYTNWVNATLPALQGAVGTFPTQYPSDYFAGWGKALPRNAWPRRGLVTVINSVVTLTGDDLGLPIGTYNHSPDSYFNQDWTPGTKIFISNSAPACANNFCTIASVANATRLNIKESLTLAQNEYVSAAFAVMLQKTTASGSVSISARLRVAKSYPHNIWSGGCANTPVTSGDGIVGYPCIFPGNRQNAGGLYFVGSSQPALRLVSLFVNSGAVSGTSAADLPNGILMGPTVPSFDPNDSSTMYIANPTKGGAVGLFKVHYVGNWTALNIAFQSTSAIPPVTNELTWQNMTPSGSGRDLRSQILANTTYKEATWGVLTSLQPQGTTGKYAVFAHLLGSQESACWIFVFDSSTGNFYRAWRTDDGSSLPGLKYAGCHAVQPMDNNMILLATNGLRWENTSMPYGGPFSAPITAVQRNGVFSSNTALPWPPAAPPATNGYDTACPVNLNPALIANGAVGNQCVTVQMKEPCSAFPAAGEAAASPCPWASTKSMVAPLAVGDFLKQDGISNGFSSWDNEGYMVVQITPLGVGAIQAVLQRNANFSYCAFGKDGVESASQLMPGNGWSVDAVPPFSCAGIGIYMDIVGNVSYPVNENLIRGHFSVTGSVGGAYSTWIGVGLVGTTNIYGIDYNRSPALISQPMDFSIPNAPPFAGYNGNFSSVQSYVDAKQIAASANMRQYAFDLRHYNGGTGIDMENPGQTLGLPTNATLQAGTTSVYKLTFTGTADAKHGIMNVWAGEKYLIEQSSAALGNSLTDANAWHFCYAYQAGECRTGSAAGNLYAVIPGADLQSSCWASQMNLRVPCAMIGPNQAMRATQVEIGAPDPGGAGQRNLSSLLMGPEQQYVYSSVMPSPDASYLLFSGFLVGGYHTSMMMAQIPPMPANSVAGPNYIPVTVSGQSQNAVYVEFGYEEYGSPSSFYCTPRREACRVAATVVNESAPFWFAHEPPSPTTGSYSIAVPTLPGRILYYHVVDSGLAGPLQAVTVPAI